MGAKVGMGRGIEGGMDGVMEGWRGLMDGRMEGLMRAGIVGDQ